MKKAVLLALVTLLCSASFAQTPQSAGPGTAASGDHPGAPDPARFAQFKQEILARQQERIGVLQQGIACIGAAQTHEQLRACRQQEQQAMEQLQRHP